MNKRDWDKGEFSKTAVIFCIRAMTAVLIWAMAVVTIGMVVDRQAYIGEVLTFASAFFGGELCLLCLKRLLAKERDPDGKLDTDHQSDHCAGDSFDHDISDPVSAEEDVADGMGDNTQDR